MKFRALLPLRPAFAIAVVGLLFGICSAQAQDGKPNILVIWGDDIGQSNISTYTFGLVGYRTPNIDRIASEGMMFTDYYGEQSCTAGRSSFITGQSVFRTGLSKVGLPGAKEGMQIEDPDDRGPPEGAGLRDGPIRQEPPGRPGRASTDQSRLRRILWEPLSPQCRGRARERGLSRRIPGFREKFGPRGVIKSAADGQIEDTGPLTKKRMETVDEETRCRGD